MRRSGPKGKQGAGERGKDGSTALPGDGSAEGRSLGGLQRWGKGEGEELLPSRALRRGHGGRKRHPLPAAGVDHTIAHLGLLFFFTKKLLLACSPPGQGGLGLAPHFLAPAKHKPPQCASALKKSALRQNCVRDSVTPWGTRFRARSARVLSTASYAGFHARSASEMASISRGSWRRSTHCWNSTGSRARKTGCSAAATAAGTGALGRWARPVWHWRAKVSTTDHGAPTTTPRIT